ncbi:MAG: type II secretion system F family protein [Patescibacteria group bacterium]|jgi:type IV pilus assembly protein PilC
MADFRYITRDSKGQKSNGVISADSKSDAIKKLRDKNLIILDISEGNLSSSKSAKKAGGSLFNRIGDKDKFVFTQQLSIMTKAGLPISQALGSLQEETNNKKFAQIIKTITADVEGGLALSQAFAKHPDIFDTVYVSILKAGEKSGKVDEVLDRLTIQMEKDNDIKAKIKGAMAYPIFVLVAMVVIVTLIMLFIVPQIQAVFIENNAKLPLVTRMVIGLADVIRRQGYIIIIALVGVFFGYRFYYRTAKGKHRIDLIKINIPIFGTLIRKVSLARFSRIFATLLGAGLPMQEIFSTSKDVVGNDIFRVEIEKAGKDVENGLDISAALKKQPHMPRMMVQLTAVGEKSGNTDVIFNNLANFMEKEVDNLTRNLTTLLEPALMLIMGGVIGSIVIAILLPIYSLTSSIT